MFLGANKCNALKILLINSTVMNHPIIWYYSSGTQKYTLGLVVFNSNNNDDEEDDVEVEGDFVHQIC